MGLGEKLNIQKLKMDISGIESQKSVDFVALGRYYYASLAGGNAPEAAQPMVSALRAKDAQIAEKNAQIAELERVIAAQEAAKNAAAAYSKPQPQPAAGTTIPNAAFCMRCGSRLGDNMAFCPGCGARIQKEEGK